MTSTPIKPTTISSLQLGSRNKRFKKGVHIEVQSKPNFKEDAPPFKQVWFQIEGVSAKSSLVIHSKVARFTTKVLIALATYRWHGKELDQALDPLVW